MNAYSIQHFEKFNVFICRIKELVSSPLIMASSQHRLREYIVKYLASIILLMAVAMCANAAPITCTQGKDNLAENALDKVHDWKSVYRNFVQFKDCDN